jgi:putative sigma-54 modulation protein
MQINVRAHNVNITPALKEYAEKKMQKLEKFFENIQEIMIELDISDASSEDARQIAMATIWASHTIIRAKESSKDMYASIDVLFDKLERQLIKHKDKMKSRKDSTHKRAIYVVNEDKQAAKKGNFPSIDVLENEKHFYSKPITPEEAAELLELEGLNFLVFRSALGQNVSVIYLMNNGDYGLIES